ncbi:hypothetical protein NL376_27660, partial [Klebsiella pneumoniae]|nr:hypothetical protein [Klebsiella pneumoniae]
NLDYRALFGVHFALFPFEKSLLKERYIAFKSAQIRARDRLQLLLFKEHVAQTRILLREEVRAARAAAEGRVLEPLDPSQPQP